MTGVLEICVDSLESVRKVIDIASQGQNRFEVCSNLASGGGLTPSYGLVRAILSAYPDARLMIMIRPRIGSFVYTEDEHLTMEADIQAFKALGVMGFVFGCLQQDGEIDHGLCDAALPLQITLHRAIDVVPAMYGSFNDIRNLGFTRVLTSGGAKTAAQGTSQIAQLYFARAFPFDSEAQEARMPASGRGRIVIMPGSGINQASATALKAKFRWLCEVHMTGSSLVPDGDPTAAKGAKLGFGEAGKWTLDRQKVAEVWDVVKTWD